ncbi:MAG: carboxypeptidase regulatory-like domain-containing protein [Acidobacteria bacterium]|nr:carboxypeptidase regulatory-like domain-containing protein [Acidobacteriota bacterium]
MKKPPLVSAIILLTATSAFAQTYTGTITCSVFDPTQAAIADAELILTNTATGETRTAKSGTDGRHTFPQLLPSTYSLRAKQGGFKEWFRPAISLTTNQTVEIKVDMLIGAVSESIEVASKQELLDTQTANRSMTLTSELMRELPLNMRNPLALVHSSAGVAAARTGVSQATQDQNHNRFSLNGGRHESTAVLVDGIPMGAGDWGGLIASPGVDAVQEVQVVRNTYDTEFGRTGGGVINISTRGGGQQFHGGVFEFYRNDNLDANSFFNNKYGKPLAEFKRNQFGGTISGPIWNAKRVYGFFGYEGLRTGAPGNRLATVPTDLQRRGDFSRTLNSTGALSVIYDPLTTVPNPASPGKYVRTPLAGNVVPSSRFDPVAVNLLKLIPTANQPGSGFTEAQNWYGTGASSTVNNRYDARVDWTRTEKHTLFGRFTIGKQSNSPVIYFGPETETNYYDRNPRYHVSIGNMFVPTPTLVINAQVGGGRWSEIQQSPGQGFDSASLGFPTSITTQFDVAAPPTWSIGDYTSLGNGKDLKAIRQIINAQINVTKQYQGHSLKFGWMWQSTQLNFMDSNSPAFSFNRYFTYGPDPDLRQTLAGNSIASLLLGTGSSGTLTQRLRPASNDAYHALYIQDTWKVTRRLTVNYGVRYEIQKGRTERYNRFAQVDFDIASPIGPKAGYKDLRGGLAFMDANNREQWGTEYNDFAPRVGVAYKITDKLVARTGYGIFFDRTTYASPLSGTDGYSVTTPWNVSFDSGRTPASYLKNPFPDGVRPVPGSSDGAWTNIGYGLGGFQQARPTPYIQQYSLDLQYQASGDTMIEVGYSGTQGRKLAYGYGVQFNQLPDQYLSMGAQLLDQVPNPFYGLIAPGSSLATATVQRGQLLRPYPQFTGVSLTFNPGSSSSYNAGIVRMVKRFSRSFMVDLSYQFSKAMDNSSENGSPNLVDGARNFNNLSLERSISSHDIPHSFAAAFLYELPFGHGRKFGATAAKWVDAIAGGWGVSGIYRLGSGLPTHSSASNNTFSFGGSQQPNVTNMNDVKVENQTLDRWFNTSAFSLPAPYTFGNAPRWFTNVRFSPVNNLDLGILKSFRITEKVKAEFRGEMFNAANRPQFGWPDMNQASNTFGQNTSMAPGASPRNIQLGLRLAF